MIINAGFVRNDFCYSYNICFNVNRLGQAEDWRLNECDTFHIDWCERWLSAALENERPSLINETKPLIQRASFIQSYTIFRTNLRNSVISQWRIWDISFSLALLEHQSHQNHSAFDCLLGLSVRFSYKRKTKVLLKLCSWCSALWTSTGEMFNKFTVVVLLGSSPQTVTGNAHGKFWYLVREKFKIAVIDGRTL